MVDVVAVPEGLENGVGETLHEQVLHGLLAQVVVDPIHLMLLEHLADHAVERDRRVEVLAEGFFDDDLGVERRAEPARRQARGPEIAQDGGEDGRRSGDVEQHLQIASQPFLDPGDVRGETLEGLGLVIPARHVAGVLPDMVPDVAVEFAAGKLLDRPGGHVAKLVVRDRLAAIADEEEISRQQMVECEIVDRGDELSRGQVARGAKNHDNGRRSAAVLAQTLEEGMTRRFGHGENSSQYASHPGRGQG